MSKFKKQTKPIDVNFDDTGADANADAKQKADFDAIIKKLDDREVAITKAFTPVAEFTALKTEFETAAKSATDMSADTKKQHDALLERFEKQEAQFKTLLPTGGPNTGLALTYKNDGENYKTAQDVEYVMFNDGSSSDIITKAVTSNINTPGSPTTSMTPYFQLQHGNIFRQLGMVIPVGSGDSVNVPTLNGNGFVVRDDQETALSDTSTVTNRKISVQVYELQKSVPIPAIDALPGLDQAYVGKIAEDAPVAEMADMIKVITEASKTGSGKLIKNVLTTGVAANLPTPANVITIMSNLKKSLTIKYQMGAVFLVSQDLMSVIRVATNTNSGSGYVFNPMSGIETLFGRRIIEADGFPDGTAAGNLNGLYGNFMNGLVTVTKRMMSINRFYETSPGRITYYAEFSSKGGITDVNATATLITGA